jgi:arylsulfatase A-like enzyme
MLSFDSDGDGMIDVTEYGVPTLLQTPFSDGDLDDNGLLDLSEFRSLMLTQAPRFQRDLKAPQPQIVPGARPPALYNGVVIRSSDEVKRIAALLARRPDSAVAVPPTPNILIVGLDTTRADRTSVYGAARDTTPNLSKLAARGTVFETALSNGNESLYSHTNLWTSMYASEAARPTYETFVIPEDATTLAEVLQAYGYSTGGFVAGGHLDASFGHSQGFDTYQAQVGFGSLWSTVPQALEWIDGRPAAEPWMAFVHGYDAHAPYRTAAPFGHRFYERSELHPTDRLMEDPMLPERIFKDTFYPGQSVFFDHPQGLHILSTETYSQVATRPSGRSKPFGPADRAHLIKHYDGCLAYADLQLGLLLAALEDRGVLDHTLVIVMGDHGEDLLDHDFVNHRTGLYEGIIKVPLVIAGPGFGAGERISGLVQIMDVLPTVLRAAGAQTPAGTRGRALQDIVSGAAPGHETVYSEGVMDMLSARTETHKLVAKRMVLADPHLVPKLAAAALTSERFELYDLRTDPGEQRNLLARPDQAVLAQAEILRAQLVAWRVDLSIGTAAQDPSKVDPAVAEQLRKHGYWKAGPPTPRQD